MTDHLTDHESIAYTDTDHLTASDYLSSEGDDPEGHADHPAFPLGLGFLISQLSTLVLSLGSHGINTRMDPQLIVSFLALTHNLENLSLHNMITAFPPGTPTNNCVYLPRLQSFSLSDGARETASILHHIVIPSDTKLDIKMISLPSPEVLVNVFYFVGRMLRGGFISMRQTVEALSLQPTDGGLMIKIYVDMPALQDIRDPELAASVRLSFPVPDQNRPWTNGLFLAVATDLDISSVKLLLMGDLAIKDLADAALTSFLSCMPMAKTICCAKTMPLGTLRWDSVITSARESNQEKLTAPVILDKLLRM